MKPASTLLPAVVAVLTLAACGSSATKTVVVTDTTTTGTGTTPATTQTPAPSLPTPTTTATVPSNSTVVTNPTPKATTTVHLTNFRSPSGNIGCVMLDGSARCDIRTRSWHPPPRPASCTTIVDFGQGLAVGRSGPASFVCAGDTALDPTGTPLTYGEASAEGKITCVSAESGMTCTNRADGHGFFISRQGYRVF